MNGVILPVAAQLSASAEHLDFETVRTAAMKFIRNATGRTTGNALPGGAVEKKPAPRDFRQRNSETPLCPVHAGRTHA